MTYLCIDYGLIHCGLALGFEGLAEPVETIATKNVEQKVQKLIRAHKPHAIVVGLSEGEMAIKTKQFAQSLEALFKVPIIFQDETLTSQEVRQDAARAGMRRSRREAKIDHLVAARILQDYIDSHLELENN